MTTELEKQQAEEISLLKRIIANLEQEIGEMPFRLATSVRRYAEKHYPKDIFDPGGCTPDSAAARFARTLCEELAKELERTANPESDTR